MKTENKTMEAITLQQIAPYLPYNLKVLVKDKIVEMTTITQYSIQTTPQVHGFKYCNREMGEFKPILYPLEYLTKTIQYQGKEVNVLFEMMKVQFTGIKNPERCIFSHGFIYYGETRLGKINLDELSYSAVNVLVKYHFNAFNLDESLYVNKA